MKIYTKLPAHSFLACFLILLSGCGFPTSTEKRIAMLEAQIATLEQYGSNVPTAGFFQHDIIGDLLDKRGELAVLKVGRIRSTPGTPPPDGCLMQDNWGHTWIATHVAGDTFTLKEIPTDPTGGRFYQTNRSR